MNIKHITVAAFLLIPTAYATEQQPMGGMPMDHNGMNMQTGPKVASNTATATGTVKNVNLEKGMVVIAHGPVEALGWPSMTMSFRATPDQLQTLKKGEHLEFDFFSEGMDAIITRIEKR